MRKPSWTLLLLLFGVGSVLTTGLFLIYHLCMASGSTKAALDRWAIDSNAITAYFTALAFMGFLAVSIFQALHSAHIEREAETEKLRRLRLEHDSMWMDLQTVRLNAFLTRGNNQDADQTMKEMLAHWKGLSEEIAAALRKHKQ